MEQGILLKRSSLYRYLLQELKIIVYAMVQRNGYDGHHENLLLWDDHNHIKKLASHRIMKYKAIKRTRTVISAIRNAAE